MLSAIGSHVNLDEDNDYHMLVADLLQSPVVQQMKKYIHHGNTTCFQHCINVSYYNYKICKFFELNVRAGARSGLLHDLFLYDWHTYKPAKGSMPHGFTHAQVALHNAEKNFSISDVEKDIIAKHMFPVNPFSLPKYKETTIIVLTDKLCCIMETLSFEISRLKALRKKTAKV